jgi:gliding motility-associated-like protein
MIVSGGSSQLNVVPAGFSYSWNHIGTLSNGSIANPVASPEVDTWYTVQVSEGECIVEDSVLVRVTDFVCGMPSIFIPNAFTPNLDNANEWLYVRGNNILELDFYLYDRWGEKVFETHSLTDGWNGYYKGKKVDPAVFVYYLRAVCDGGDEFFHEGNITVLE